MASSTKSPFPITDFSGGITDNVFSGELNRHFVLDNFTILPDRKIMMRPGSVVDDPSNDTIPAGNQRVSAIINYAKNDKLFVLSGTQAFYRSGAGVGAYTTLQGPSSNDIFTAGDTTSAPSFAEWNKQLFVTNDGFPTLMRIYKDGSGNYQVRNVGMPALATAPTVTEGASGSNSYVYGFVYSYVYTVGSQTFKEISAVTEVVLASAAAPNSNSVAISAIPALTNSGGMNYDTTVITVDIYRTINNGTNFYKIASIANATATYTDSLADTDLQTHEPLYINDGTLDWDAPPQAKFIHVVGNTGFLGYTKDVDGEHPFRLQQSNPTNVNFWPKGFTLDVQEEVKGVKSVANLPILLCVYKIFRIDGLFDPQGRNGMNAVKIHDSAGCLSHLSCVEAEGMLYWWGNDGIYATDGYNVQKVSDHLNTRYTNILNAMSSQKRIYGKFDPLNRRIYWGVESNPSSLDNDSIVTLDLRWGISPNMSFFTWSGTSFRPTALEIFNNFLYRGDTRGYVFKHSSSSYTDPKIDTLLSATLWNSETIIWDYVSLQHNFGGTFFRKFVTRILLQAGDQGNTSIQINAVNDQGRATRALKIIRWRKGISWGDDNVIWGVSNCPWGGSGLIDEWRRFPAKGLRLSYLQIEITNGFSVVSNSDTQGTCILDPVLQTMTLSGGETWPSKSVDYVMTLENDNYVQQYKVLSIDATGTILTTMDTGSKLPVAGTYKWELFGFVKGEALNLLGYNLHWENVDQNSGTYQGGDNGANA